MFSLSNHFIQNEVVYHESISQIMMIIFLILVLTNYQEWSGDESTYFISQTKQKSEEREDDRLAYYSNQTHY